MSARRCCCSWPALFFCAAVLGGCFPMMTSSGGPREGAVAPAAEGTDSAGRPLRLRDHRGKVVLLSFWHGG